jgi:hypothetical protein
MKNNRSAYRYADEEEKNRRGRILGIDGEVIRPPPRVRSHHGAPTGLPPREELVREYHRFVAGLNRTNGGLLWWAGPLASRNPFDSPLYEALVEYVALLGELQGKSGAAKGVRVTGENPLISRDIDTACRDTGAAHDRKPGEILRPAALIFLGLIHSLYFVGMNLYRRALVRIYLGGFLDQALQDQAPARVIRTWIDHRSFDPEGRYHDAYFGRLPAHLGASGRVILVAEIIWTCSYLSAMKKIRAQFPGEIIVPQEYFFSVLDILRATLQPLGAGRGNIGEATFHGHDVKGIVARAIQRDRASIQVRNNLGIYYMTRKLAGAFPITHFIYSFENHAFEKMMILALRERSPGTRIIGYQHGGISRMLLNYFLAEGEASTIPLPDRILTTGKETRRVLTGEGHIPPGVVETSCALRYEYLQEMPLRLRGNGGNLFVPLPVDSEAARAVLDILVQAVGDRSDYAVRLKHHPLVTREDIIGVGEGKRLPRHITCEGEGTTTRDLLSWSDVVLYTQTTTCIEALMLGIPVVFLDIFTMYDADYILKEIPFRWVADDPESLCRALSLIRGLADADFTTRQAEGVAYAKSFFAPVDEASLEKFIS